jgi:hypothetical protein
MWPIVVGIVALLLVGTLAFLALRDDDSEETATTGPTTTAATTTTTPPEADTSPTDPTDVGSISAPECSTTALLAAVDDDIAAEDAEVTDFACTPASASGLGIYAWAQLEAAGVDPLIVFFAAYEGDPPAGGPTDVDWRVLTYGSDVACEDEIPVEACDLLTGAPRR